ncbi:MAG: 2-phospho-L-lactate guanylyltransferase [Chloroflexi bacterium]|nr:2-phospho-L-lactate guanylyltransferase [Chloroflexota bacterium]
MKPIPESKSRLVPSVSDERRSMLSLGMLVRVLASASATPRIQEVVVYGGDGPVQDASDRLGAGWRPDPEAGLNGCLKVAFSDAAGEGFDCALFLPADLPLATAGDLSAFLETADSAQLALSPDTANDGTNALLVDLTVPFPTKLGNASFSRHVEQAKRLDIGCVVYRSEGLGLDIDTASDLDRLIELEPGLWEHLDRELQEAGLGASLPVCEGAE